MSQPLFDILVKDLKRESFFKLHILSIDPGKTTGVVTLRDSKIDLAVEVTTDDIEESTQYFHELLERKAFDLIVIEDYKVYSWKTKSHAWEDLHTPRLIGSIETLARIHKLPKPVKQMAHVAKGFVTDDKLKQWNYYIKGKKHTRDAIRHLLYYVLFGKPVEKRK